ncbi:MAG: hypothetical protein J6Z30_08535 [Pyramidobacter sp.]|nr:hypothetical protein [Pyramidobacter sp.]
MNGHRLAEGSFAATAVMPWDKELKECPVGGGEERLKTRLGVMDVCASCSSSVASPLDGGQLFSFSIPAWMFGDGLAELDALPKNDSGAFLIEPRREDGVICFDLDGQTFYYDETGLISQHEYEAGENG